MDRVQRRVRKMVDQYLTEDKTMRELAEEHSVALNTVFMDLTERMYQHYPQKADDIEKQVRRNRKRGHQKTSVTMKKIRGRKSEL